MNDKRRPPPRPTPGRPTPRAPSAHELRKLADQAEKFEEDFATVTRRDHVILPMLSDPPTPLRAGRPSSMPPEQKREVKWLWARGRWSAKILYQGALLAAGAGIADWLWHLIHDKP